MRCIKTCVLPILISLAHIAFAQNANYLKYKFMESKKGAMQENGGIEFWSNADTLIAKKTYERYPQPLKVFDKADKMVIFDFEEQREYVIEELDSLYGINSRLVSTGEKETINGFQCEKYSVQTKMVVAGKGIYGLQTSSTAYSFTIWLTTDISGNESLSPYIASCLTGNVFRFTFKGTIAKVESSAGGATVLDDKAPRTTKAKEYVMPWKSSVPYAALLPEENHNGYLPGLLYTEEPFTAYYNRMRNLLSKITGNEKPKFKTRPLSIAAQ